MIPVIKWLPALNAFIEDTCVIFATAYLLSRGKGPQSLLGEKSLRKGLRSGVVFGLLASTEILFPGLRTPYQFHTLAVFAGALLGGWACALVGDAIVLVFVAVLMPTAAVETAVVLALASSFGIILRLRGVSPLRQPWVVGFVGGLSQGAAYLADQRLLPALGIVSGMSIWPSSIFANAFGLVTIMLVLRDAETRSRSEQNQLEAERMRTLLVSADLAALRARIRPHFLFNALTAIAALCRIDAAKAEESILKLGLLFRRSLSVDTLSLVSLESEIEYVRNYLDIQLTRFGGRISVHFDLDPQVSGTALPAFSLQTLVENAFNHGFAGMASDGRLEIAVRRAHRFSLIAVKDNGAGMDFQLRAAAIQKDDQPIHGLGIIDRELNARFGPSARLRIFSKPGGGTLVAFRVPSAPHFGEPK